MFAAAATELGALLGAGGHTLVYGGGGTGIMGTVARAAKAAGARVEGVVPQSLVGSEHAWHEGADEMLVVHTMRLRKAIMDAKAEAFLALPGGFGTLEEVAEILTLKILGHTDRPLVLLNTAGHWDPLLELFEHFYKSGFGQEKYRALYQVAATPAEAMDLLAAARR